MMFFQPMWNIWPQRHKSKVKKHGAQYMLIFYRTHQHNISFFPQTVLLLTHITMNCPLSPTDLIQAILMTMNPPGWNICTYNMDLSHSTIAGVFNRILHSKREKGAYKPTTAKNMLARYSKKTRHSLQCVPGHVTSQKNHSWPQYVSNAMVHSLFVLIEMCTYFFPILRHICICQLHTHTHYCWSLFIPKSGVLPVNLYLNVICFISTFVVSWHTSLSAYPVSDKEFPMFA